MRSSSQTHHERTHLDLFSGIGGFALAARWAGYRTVAFCERDEFCQRVLRKHWSDGPIHPDIFDLDGKRYAGVTLLTGGFPCQPFSVAGKRQGKEDDRHLWPEMVRIIEECRPRYVLGENVPGIIGMELDNCFSDLERIGYSCGTLVIPACAVDARHRRDRVWIVAHAEQGLRGRRSDQSRRLEEGGAASGRIGEAVSDTGRTLLQRRETKPEEGATKRVALGGLGRGSHGLSAGMDAARAAWADGTWEDGIPRVATGIPDRVNRLKALGNAIVPQVAFQILKHLT